jgi:hypothetical protein
MQAHYEAVVRAKQAEIDALQEVLCQFAGRGSRS